MTWNQVSLSPTSFAKLELHRRNLNISIDTHLFSRKQAVYVLDSVEIGAVQWVAAWEDLDDKSSIHVIALTNQTVNPGIPCLCNRSLDGLGIREVPRVVPIEKIFVRVVYSCHSFDERRTWKKSTKQVETFNSTSTQRLSIELDSKRHSCCLATRLVPSSKLVPVRCCDLASSSSRNKKPHPLSSLWLVLLKFK